MGFLLTGLFLLLWLVTDWTWAKWAAVAAILVTILAIVLDALLEP